MRTPPAILRSDHAEAVEFDLAGLRAALTAGSGPERGWQRAIEPTGLETTPGPSDGNQNMFSGVKSEQAKRADRVSEISQLVRSAGRDGWLFLVGGRYRPTKLYRRNPAMWWRLRRWRQRIERRAARCTRLGIRFVQTVAPEKLTILFRYCAEPVIDPTLAPAVRMHELMKTSPRSDCYVDLVQPLLRAAETEEIYPRTDSHWNHRGCFVGYRTLCATLGTAPRVDLVDRPFVTFDQVLDLGCELTPPISEPYCLYTIMQDSRRCSVNEVVHAFLARGGVGPAIGTEAAYKNGSPRADPRRVLIFGDSYAHYDPIGLTAMLAETFREVRFVWSTGVDWRIVEEVRPDILICEIAERYLAAVPKDAFDLRKSVARYMRNIPQKRSNDR